MKLESKVVNAKGSTLPYTPSHVGNITTAYIHGKHVLIKFCCYLIVEKTAELDGWIGAFALPIIAAFRSGLIGCEIFFTLPRTEYR